MGGTQEGARKRRATMIKKAGGVKAYLELQRNQASKGGKKSPSNFKRNRKLASLAGRRSKPPKRTHQDQPDHVHDKQYKNEISYRDKNFKMGREIDETLNGVNHA